jgi:hypothetical protein
MQLPYTHKLLNAQLAAANFEAMAARAEDLSRPLDRFGAHLVRKTARILRSGERGVQARHASGLAAALTYVVYFGTQVRWSAAKAYAAMLQFGGIAQSSRSGGYLAIPIADNVKGNGDPRFVSPTLVKDGFFFRSASGALLYGRVNKRIESRRKGATGRAGSALRRASKDLRSTLELLFVLKRSVVINAYRYMSIDPGDLTVWRQRVADWVLRGR